MSNTILFGPSGFLGPAILKKYPKIIAVGRNKPPYYCNNKFIKINDISRHVPPFPQEDSPPLLHSIRRSV